MSYKEAYIQAKTLVKDGDKQYLLPVSKARGMVDFVKDILGSNEIDYCEALHWVMFNSNLKVGGYLLYTGGTDCPLCDEGSMSWYRACMEAYDKYLCADGRIRCVKDEDADRRFARLDKKYSDDFWEGINQSFEAAGMFYSEERGCWVNPETGEEGCY